MKAELKTAPARLQQRRSRSSLLISITLHVLAAWGAACLILHFPAPAKVAAGGGDDAGDDGEPVALSHAAPPVRLPHTAMPRIFPDKAPLLRSAAPAALSLPSPSLVFMPAPPVPAMNAAIAASPHPSARAARQSGKGRGGKGRAGTGSGARGDGPGNLASASAMPAAPTSPQLLRSTAPEYPAGARSRGEHGTVWVRVQVSAAGRVVDASVHRSCGHGDLDASAVRTARRWMFAPATAGGQPVSAPALVKVNFVLR